MEALVRWDHPEQGLLEPSEFVPAAEQSGLAIPMGEQILRESCLSWQRSGKRKPPYPSASDVRDPLPHSSPAWT